MIFRGGKYSEEDAKAVMIQNLNVVSFCHLQGVVHRDLKLEVINNHKDEKLNDIVGGTYSVAPEVLHRSYGTEADMWNIGLIAYMLLSGSRPFWARTESGIFRAVLKTEPSFEEDPWPTLSSDAKDFTKRLLNKDYRKRMTALQALCHSWIRDSQDVKIQLDIVIFKHVRAYIYSSSLRKTALKALAKTVNVSYLPYYREQFILLGPNKSGYISIQNFKTASMKYLTEAMKQSKVLDFVDMVSSLQYNKLDYEEFVAASISIYQVEGQDDWELLHARRAYELFEKDGNRAIVVEELASELGLGPTVSSYVVLQGWVRHSDGKLSFLGFLKLLHGVSTCSLPKPCS